MKAKSEARENGRDVTDGVGKKKLGRADSKGKKGEEGM